MAQLLAISKKTKNVLTATNPNDFIFRSDLNTFKILAEGKLLNQLVDSATKTFSVAHGLEYTPNFYAFCQFPGGEVSMAGPLSFNMQGTGTTPTGYYGEFTPEADSSNLYFILTKIDSNYSVNIKWYIFEAEL